jgi:hypothetical protein
VSTRAKVGWRDHGVGALLGCSYVAWLLATARSLGFARDEGFYFRAGARYSHWFETLLSRPSEAVQQSFIDGIWSENHEHPALMKSLFGLSWTLFHEKWKIFDDASTAFRFPGMAMMGMALWVTYLFGARAYSRRAGVLAAVLLGLMPRVFYNAHLCCFDVPIMAMWAWCIYVYWRSQVRGGLGWALAAGLVYGLTLETKHNAWFLPAVVVPHAFFIHRHAIARQLRAGRIALPATLVAMATVGPLVFLFLWPWMWNDTIQRLQGYFAFHLNHEYYNMEFLHVNYFSAPSPRLYMPVMIVATVPAVTLALFAVGLFSRAALHVERFRAWAARQLGRAAARVAAPDRVETDLLFVLAFGVAVGPWLLPKTPIFGGTKHWLTAYPFLCLFAGHGFDRIATAATRTLATSGLMEKLARVVSGERRAELAVQSLLVASVVAAPLAVTAHSHPFGLSSYVPLVGGTAGGADLGLNRQFWGFTTESLATYFAANAPRGATVFINDTTYDSWARLLDERRVRPDLRAVGAPSEAEISVVHIEKHMMEVEYGIWTAYGTTTPAYVLTHDGVPIIDVFRRKH